MSDNAALLDAIVVKKFNGGLPKLLILALCTGWIINSRQTNHTVEITAVVKDEQWRLLVSLLLLKLACVGDEQENKKKVNSKQMVPYFEYTHTLTKGQCQQWCVQTFHLCLFNYSRVRLKKTNITGTCWMELCIYLCQYVITNYWAIWLGLISQSNCCFLNCAWTRHPSGHFCLICVFHIFWWFISLVAFLV